MNRMQLAHPQLRADVAVGHQFPDVVHRPTEVQLFRYCATTWNSHRIHYDRDYTINVEGYPNVLVQSHLHGAWLTSYATDLAGEDGVLQRLSYSVRRFAIPGDVLGVSGAVREVEQTEAGTLVHLDLAEVRESDGVACCVGDATVLLPKLEA